MTSSSDPAYIAFRKGPDGLIGRIIRWRTGSIYSHVEFVKWIDMKTDMAVCYSASWLDGGVRTKAIRLSPDKWDLVVLDTRFFPKIAHEIYLHGKIHAGKKYDLFGALFWKSPLQKHLMHKRKWFCSELVAACLGFPRPHHFSPGSLHEKLVEDWLGSGMPFARPVHR